MTLSDDYKRQFAWRDWPTILDALPELPGSTVLDLGCGVGDLAVELSARGARVIGVDANRELLSEACSRGVPNSEFRYADLRNASNLATAADGIWCSFTAAYFPDLTQVLSVWANNLKQGGWIAITEIDDLFGHRPLLPETEELLRAYAEDAFSAGRYDFHMGHRLNQHLERAGFVMLKTLTLVDRELSFHGPADPDVRDAWEARFNRMTLLRDFCEADFDRVREDFLSCLMREDHRSDAKVFGCIARLSGGRGPG